MNKTDLLYQVALPLNWSHSPPCYGKQITSRKITTSLFLRNSIYWTVNNLMGASNYSCYNQHNTSLCLSDHKQNTVLSFNKISCRLFSQYHNPWKPTVITWQQNHTRMGKTLHLPLVTQHHLGITNSDWSPQPQQLLTD